MQILKGIQELHKHNKIHWDIKHENILINFPKWNIESDEEIEQAILEWDCLTEPIEVFLTDFGTSWNIVEEDSKGKMIQVVTNSAGTFFMPD